MAKAFLHKAAKRMKKWADKHRRPAGFQVGDQVLVKLYPGRIGIFRGRHRGLLRKYEGPFTITKKVGKLAYKLELPPDFKVHPVFHVCNLKQFYPDDGDPECSVPQRAPIMQRAPATQRAEKHLSQILRHKVNYLGETKKYLVQWEETTEPTWELAFRMNSRYPAEVRAYHETDGAEDDA